MASEPLRGAGVLVTRPAKQAQTLCDAIAAAGGTPVRFPVIDIVARDAVTIARDADALPQADIAVFVSSNAARYGLKFLAGADVAVVGPATAAYIEESGTNVAIAPTRGFDSEALLEMPQLKDVTGKNVRIIRGDGGRELLGDTLRERGARVDALTVYERRLSSHSNKSLQSLEHRWLAGKIAATTVMSVASLKNLLALLPKSIADRFATVPLVTPATRVIKEAQIRYPGLRPILANGPMASDMTEAIVTSLQDDPD